jgi:HTH-type transcriptional regulator / antitoxin HigA
MATATRRKSSRFQKITTAASYAEIVKVYPPRIIRDRRRLDDAYQVIDLLMAIRKPSADQLDFLELLSMLVEQLESTEHPIPHTSLASLLAHLIESKGESQTALAGATGIQKSLISEVLSGRRSLSIENIKRLAKHFSVEPGVFLDCV